jgi:hypothetical protein
MMALNTSETLVSRWQSVLVDGHLVPQQLHAFSYVSASADVSLFVVPDHAGEYPLPIGVVIYSQSRV